MELQLLKTATGPSSGVRGSWAAYPSSKVCPQLRKTQMRRAPRQSYQQGDRRELQCASLRSDWDHGTAQRARLRVCHLREERRD